MKLSEKEKTAKIEQEKALLNVELECLKRERLNERIDRCESRTRRGDKTDFDLQTAVNYFCNSFSSVFFV